MTPIEEKMIDNQLRWLEHVQRSLEAPVKRIDHMIFSFVKKEVEGDQEECHVNNIHKNLVFN